MDHSPNREDPSNDPTSGASAIKLFSLSFVFLYKTFSRVQSILLICTGDNVIKLFTDVMNFHNKLECMLLASLSGIV